MLWRGVGEFHPSDEWILFQIPHTTSNTVTAVNHADHRGLVKCRGQNEGNKTERKAGGHMIHPRSYFLAEFKCQKATVRVAVKTPWQECLNLPQMTDVCIMVICTSLSPASIKGSDLMGVPMSCMDRSHHLFCCATAHDRNLYWICGDKQVEVVNSSMSVQLGIWLHHVWHQSNN